MFQYDIFLRIPYVIAKQNVIRETVRKYKSYEVVS